MTALNLEIKSKLDSLQAALLSAHPEMPNLLREVRNTLKAQPEQVTLMTEDEIAIVVAGLEKQTNSHLAASASKPTKAKKESLKSVTSDELGF